MSFLSKISVFFKLYIRKSCALKLIIKNIYIFPKFLFYKILNFDFCVRISVNILFFNIYKLIIYFIKYYDLYNFSFIITFTSLSRRKIKKFIIIIFIIFFNLIFFFFNLNIVENYKYIIKNDVNNNLYTSKFVLLIII